MRKVSPFRIFRQTNVDGSFSMRARFYAEDGSLVRTVTLEARTRPSAYHEARKLYEAGHPVRSDGDPLAFEYLVAAWDPRSDFIISKKLRKRSMTLQYVVANKRLIEIHAKKYLGTRRVSGVDAVLLEEMMLSLSKIGKGARVINRTVQAIRGPIKYWCRVNRRPYTISAMEPLAEWPQERGILDIQEIRKIVALETIYTPVGRSRTPIENQDPRPRAATLLGLLCGMRAGECRGLHWSDVDHQDKILRVQHNWTDTDKLHAPKCGSTRIVPAPDVVLLALEKCRSLSPCKDPRFVLWNLRDHDAPMSVQAIGAGFARILRAIGIYEDEARARRLVFHSTRHTYVSFSLSQGIPPHVVRLMTGHSAGTGMQERYSHATMLDFQTARASLEAVVRG